MENIASEIHLEWLEMEQPMPLTLDKEQVHLFFSLNESISFGFGPYSRNLNAEKAFMIYNPEKSLEAELKPTGCSRLVYLKLELSNLHELFVVGSQQAPVFNPENSNRKFYEEKGISSALLIVLNQLYYSAIAPNTERLYRIAKSFEILSLFFSEAEPSKTNCPFLNDQNIVLKIKQAKEILIGNYADPPQMHDLALKCGLNELQLKTAFKEIYGNTPYQYLLDYKLDISKNLLLSGKYQVNEVAYKVGYSNPSHYIDAFKKKYGLTPKKVIGS